MNARATFIWAIMALALAGCGENKERAYQGWVEADLIFISPDEYGRVARLAVREGDRVEAGAPLFSLDDDLQLAELNQNNATLANARQTYERTQALSRTGAGTQAALDSALSVLRVAEARVNTAQTRLARRRAVAPIAGTVQQVYFREGETVPAQRPVLAILPPGNMKVRFFVPEKDLARVAVGQEVRIGCDGCAPDLAATVHFIATTAEYTPPVIYSLDERAKLVFMVQARPAAPDKLRVGQPVDVRLRTGTP